MFLHFFTLFYTFLCKKWGVSYDFQSKRFSKPQIWAKSRPICASSRAVCLCRQPDSRKIPTLYFCRNYENEDHRRCFVTFLKSNMLTKRKNKKKAFDDPENCKLENWKKVWKNAGKMQIVKKPRGTDDFQSNVKKSPLNLKKTWNFLLTE